MGPPHAVTRQPPREDPQASRARAENGCCVICALYAQRADEKVWMYKVKVQPR